MLLRQVCMLNKFIVIRPNWAIYSILHHNLNGQNNLHVDEGGGGGGLDHNFDGLKKL